MAAHLCGPAVLREQRQRAETASLGFREIPYEQVGWGPPRMIREGDLGPLYIYPLPNQKEEIAPPPPPPPKRV